jgi:hypothetical protein
MLQPIVQALTKKCSDEKENLNYYAEYTTDSPNAHVSVEGLGQLSFPLGQDSIHNKLIVVKDDNLYQMARTRFTTLKEYQSKLSIAASEDLHV